ncbi:hypothetical protein CYMTET_35976, partial [Cymbomonas tetramitiformis]
RRHQPAGRPASVTGLGAAASLALGAAASLAREMRRRHWHECNSVNGTDAATTPARVSGVTFGTERGRRPPARARRRPRTGAAASCRHKVRQASPAWEAQLRQWHECSSRHRHERGRRHWHSATASPAGAAASRHGVQRRQR